MTTEEDQAVASDRLDSAAILEKLDDIIDALQGSIVPGSPPGILSRMAACEIDRADLRAKVAELTVAVRDLQAQPGRTALSWAERLALLILTIALTSAGAILGQQIGGRH